ncbi:MAG: DNA primase [Planctomycetaceae bacterium]|nr:DNA primase [Planctomycetales bacterium]MCB9926680.1 DNA primase [Planctomycetaceae bacterium]
MTMSFGPNNDAKEQVRQAVDIVDLVGSYMPLRRQGANFVGLCPWHEDTKPSFNVNQARQSWKCWVCNDGGDIFSFVMKREGIDFREALEMLADRAGIELRSHAALARPESGSPGDKKTLYAACAWAEEQFQQCLNRSAEADVARKYFASRNVNSESAKRFHLGFSPDSWQWLLDRARSTPFSPQVLEAAGLLAKSPNSGKFYDRFKGRVIFPIRDPQSRPIGFGGRILPEFATERSAKYINSQETRLYSKSDQLYALDLAGDNVRKSKNVIVMEGYTDVIMAHQFGLQTAVAVCGTALTERHIRVLRRYADTITLVLDGDDAGQRRTNEILELFVASEMDLRILTLPQGLDPCDYLLTHGSDGMQSLLDKALDAFEHAVETRTRGIDLLRDTHRANQALEQLLSTISKAPRMTGDTSSSRLLRERQVIARLAREFRVDETSLRTRISELRKATPALRTKVAEAPRPRLSVSDLDPCDAELIELLTQHPELADEALTAIVPDELSSRPTRTIYETYQVVLGKGEPVEFNRVLTELDDPQLKNLLVSLDEQAIEKEKHVQEDAASRLRWLIEHLRGRREADQGRAKQAALEQRNLGEDEELDLLQQLVEQERKRQGIPAPTDG